MIDFVINIHKVTQVISDIKVIVIRQNTINTMFMAKKSLSSLFKTQKKWSHWSRQKMVSLLKTKDEINIVQN